jgi:hypothetical protein
MPVQDQAVWKTVTLSTAGVPHVYARGDLLPPPTTDAEANQRSLARLGGALRVVEVVFTPEELATRGRAHGQSPSQASEAAGVVSATVTPPVNADPRVATVGAPVVLGPKPAAHATKKEWKEYAITQGMGEAEAEAMTRDALAEQYRDR